MPLETLRLLICSFCELQMVSGEEEGLSRPQHRGTCCPPTMAFFSSTHAREPGNAKLKSGKSAGHDLLHPKHLKHGWCTIYIFSACICILDPQLAICKQAWIHCTALDVYLCNRIQRSFTISLVSQTPSGSAKETTGKWEAQSMQFLLQECKMISIINLTTNTCKTLMCLHGFCTFLYQSAHLCRTTCPFAKVSCLMY